MTKYEEEAKELVEQFQAQIKEYPAEIYPNNIENQQAIQCALIAVDLVLKELRTHFIPIVDHIKHWQKVKEAIKAIKS